MPIPDFFYDLPLGVSPNMTTSETNSVNHSPSITSIEAMLAGLPKPDPIGLTGRMLVDRWICTPARFVRWRRKHRKSRINKKWQKRYGPVLETCKGVAYNVGGTMLACPCMANALKLNSK